jgi:hypothetical protein
VTATRVRLAGEPGQGIIAGVLLLAGVLVPLLFIAPLFGRIESANLAAQQAARDAVRSAAKAPGADQAQIVAQQAVALARGEYSIPLRLTLAGRFSRGSTLTARIDADVHLATLPVLGRFGSVAVHGVASAPVDSYRSLPAARGSGA